MSELVYKNTKVLIDGVDISGKSNSVNLNVSADLKDRTTFGSSARKRLSGLWDTEITGEGFYDVSTELVDKTLWDDVGSTDQIFSCIPEGTSLGNVVYSAQKLCGDYRYNFTVGELANWSFACYGQGTMVRQTLMESGLISTNLSATVQNLGLRKPQETMYATLHNIRGTTSAGKKLVVKVQTATSSGFSSSTLSTSLKFNAVTTAVNNAQWRTTQSSTQHEWVRTVIASSGSTDGTINGFLSVGYK